MTIWMQSWKIWSQQYIFLTSKRKQILWDNTQLLSLPTCSRTYSLSWYWRLINTWFLQTKKIRHLLKKWSQRHIVVHLQLWYVDLQPNRFSNENANKPVNGLWNVLKSQDSTTTRSVCSSKIKWITIMKRKRKMRN